MKDLLSVVVPAKNCERYIEKCVTSILEQKYQNIEVILIDDHSDDQTLSKMEIFAQKDNRVFVHKAVENGIGNARNEGIGIAKGNYITFVDADDYVHPDIYSSLMERIISEDAYIALCDFFEWIPSKNIVSPREALGGMKNAKSIYTKDDKDRILFSVMVWNKIFRKSLFNDIQFQKQLKHQDLGTIPKLLFNAPKIVYINTPYYYYRRDNNASVTNSLMSSPGVEQFQLIDIFDDIINWMKSNAGSDYSQEIDFLMLNHILLRFEMFSKLPIKAGKKNIKIFLDYYNDNCFNINIMDNKYIKSDKYNFFWRFYSTFGLSMTLFILKVTGKLGVR